MSTIPERNVYARTLVWRMFRDAGDEDYLVARWSARAKLPFQFHWSAQQTLEKYLKGILLLNDKSVVKFGHNLIGLNAEAKTIAGDLIPKELLQPSYFPEPTGFAPSGSETTDTFIARLNERGHTDNRYRHYSMTFDGYDLHRFDKLCFHLRRLIFPLEMNYASTPKTYREILTENSNFQPHPEFPFFGFKDESARAECLGTLKWRNFSYFEEEAIENAKINTGFFMSNSQLYMSSQRGEIGHEAIEWLIAKARFSSSDLAQLRDLDRKSVV